MFFFFHPENDPDTKKLAEHLAADDVLGERFWTWELLAEWGISLNRQEAEVRIEQGYLNNPVRSELYDTLFQFHPELIVSLNPRGDDRRPHSFVMKLSESPDWPNPRKELEFLEKTASQYKGRLVWFGCGSELSKLSLAARERSRAILFCVDSEAGFMAYAGQILGRGPSRPSARYLEDLYPSHGNVKSWVLLGSFTKLDFDGLEQIPGVSGGNRPAIESFRHQNAMSYWQFDDEELAKFPLKHS